MSQNPSWPLLVGEFNPSGALGYGTWSANTYTDLTARLVQQWGTSRGRQFELDEVQPGTWSGVWDNRDGNLDPSNTAGILSPNLLPYRPWRIRAQWPATVNLLSADQATGGEGTPLAPGTSGAAYLVGTLFISGVQVVTAASTSAWQGTQVWQSNMAAGSYGQGAVPLAVGQIPIPIGRIGLPFTFSVRVRSVTASVNPTVNATFAWYDATGNLLVADGSANTTLTGAANAPWTQLTFTDTVPAKAASVIVAVVLMAPLTLASPAVLQYDGLQLEQNSAATAFTVPGTWYPLYGGMIERYPQVWNDTGAFGTVTPTAVDLFALLSQVQFPDLMTANVNAPRSPTGAGLDFCYRLGEQAGATSFADATGQRQPAVPTSAPGLTSGVAQTSAHPGGTYLAAPGTTVVNLNPGANAGSYNYIPEPALLLPPGPNGLYGPPTSGGFTRMIAYRQTAAVPGSGQSAIFSADTPTGSYVMLSIINGNGLMAQFGDLVGGGGNIGLGSLTVGDWHLAIISADANGNYYGCVDGNLGGVTFAKPWKPTDQFTADTLGADAVSGLAEEYTPFAGDLAWYCQWPFQLTPNQMSRIWNTWKNAGAGESTGARYNHILALAGYNGPAITDPGVTTNLPAMTDVAGQDALTALNAVVTTENGQHFVDANGVIRFQDRSHRAKAASPAYVFGENAAAGELPYDTVAFDFDPTHIGNDIQITQNSTGAVFRAFDAVSQANYGIRTVTRTTQATNGLEVQDAAHFLLNRYAKARLRISALTLNPGANPALWPVCLALELGTRIRVNRRPPGAPMITFDGFVEAINWNADDGAHATVDLQVSPADGWTAWTGAATHFTYNGNLLASSAGYFWNTYYHDAAGNPINADFSVGQQFLATYPGGSETITLTGVGSNGNVQFTSAVATPGPVVFSDLLPAGATDPTSFDAMAVLGKTTTLGY